MCYNDSISLLRTLTSFPTALRHQPSAVGRPLPSAVCLPPSAFRSPRSAVIRPLWFSLHLQSPICNGQSLISNLQSPISNTRFSPFSRFLTVNFKIIENPHKIEGCQRFFRRKTVTVRSTGESRCVIQTFRASRLPFIFSYKQTHCPFIHLNGDFSKIIKNAHKIRNFAPGKWRKMVTVKTGDCADVYSVLDF